MRGNPAVTGGLVNEYADVVEHQTVFDHVGFFLAAKKAFERARASIQMRLTEFGRALFGDWISRRKKMENVMLYRFVPVVFAALALAFLTCQSASAEEKTHEGKIVKAGDGKLTMTNKDGSKQHTHDVAEDATITRDGKEVKLAELKQGDFVKVTTKTDDKDKTWATKIAAQSKE